MKKRLAALFVALALTLTSLGLAAAPALADDELPTVKVDVGGDNGDYGDYKIDDDQIVLLKPEVIYELSGESGDGAGEPGRQVIAANSGASADQYFYLRFNNVELWGDITAQDEDNFNLCIEVPDGAGAYVETIKALRLNITGAGQLHAQSLDAGPASADSSMAAESRLWVRDTQIDVRRSKSATTSCVWTGDAELSGNASVTYTSAGDYAALRVGNGSKPPATLTIKEGANLSCLHSDKDAPSGTYVDGLYLAGKLVMSDSAHLEAEARPLEGGLEGEGGAAVYCSGDIEIKDSAMVEAYGTGKGIHCMGDLSVSGQGARVDASATDGCGILVELGMNVSDGALVATDGYLAALNASKGMTVNDAFLVATSETWTTFAADNSSKVPFTISNSHVELGAGEGCNVFKDNIEATVDNSWINVTTGNDFIADITNSVIFIGDQGTVIGDAKISYAAEVGEGQTLTIPEGASLTLVSVSVDPEEAPEMTFTNSGTVNVQGTFNSNGVTVECTSHCGGKATCASGALCDVCGTEYGEPDPHNHAYLSHVEAKAATTAAEGNIEYWFCNACCKYFSDGAAEHEISQASTVIPKLSKAPEPAEKTVVVEKKTVTNKTVTGKASGNRLAATGDSSAAFAVAAAVLGCAFIAGAALVCKRS